MVRTIRIRKGLDIPIAGAPEQSIHDGPEPSQVALDGRDYPGLKPRMLVKPGDKVDLGQPLFIDKRDPVVQFTAPGKGVVVAVNRGARRALECVEIKLEESGGSDVMFDPLTDDDIGRQDRADLASRLQRSGLWTALRTRPYSRVPQSDSVPRSIFVTAIDSTPLCADPRMVIGPNVDAFTSGMRVLSRLTEGPVYLCTGRGWDISIGDVERLRRVEFTGPHPAGLAGTHIHFLDPAGRDRIVWHIGYQDVVAIGRTMTSGTLDIRRVVALGGDRVRKPRLLSTRLGASTDDIVQGEVDEPGACRVISGSLLTGRKAAGGNAYLGRFHNQVCVIGEGGERRRFGWLGLWPRKYSAGATVVKRSGHRKRFAFDTSMNGRFTSMLPLRVFEQVMPLDILPSPLFRALLVKDTDQAQALGCLELDEEDLALCSFVCPAKQDYGVALRMNLDQIERDG
jgi:Na+-transporting NADH:ubiquinone oxidoreductase subunit A